MTKPAPYIAYYRVSTDKQQRSGLGLLAQQTAVDGFITNKGGNVVTSFTETESGRKNNRTELKKALHACRVHKGVLVIAKLDRLARNAAFLLNLRDAGVEFVCCDMPDANRLTVGIMALVAEEEARMISIRTKAALQAAKVRGQKLGGFRGYKPTVEDRQRAKEVKTANAFAWATDICPIIEEIQNGGVKTLRGIARSLNGRGVPTSKGGQWQAVQVQRVMIMCEKM